MLSKKGSYSTSCELTRSPVHIPHAFILEHYKGFAYSSVSTQHPTWIRVQRNMKENLKGIYIVLYGYLSLFIYSIWALIYLSKCRSWIQKDESCGIITLSQIIKNARVLFTSQNSFRGKLTKFFIYVNFSMMKTRITN
jgi:hypothetical protein